LLILEEIVRDQLEQAVHLAVHLKCAWPSSKVWRQLAQVVTGSSAPVFSICSILILNVL